MATIRKCDFCMEEKESVSILKLDTDSIMIRDHPHYSGCDFEDAGEIEFDVCDVCLTKMFKEYQFIRVQRPLKKKSKRRSEDYE